MAEFLKRLLKHPGLILVVMALVTAGFFIAMINNTHLETDLDEYMPQLHPAFVYSNQAEEWFDIKDGIVIAIENPEGIYNTVSLQKLKSLTKALQKLEQIEKTDVFSLHTADNIIGTEDGMDVKAFFKKVPADNEALLDLRDKVRSNDMIAGRLVSADETTALIIAEIGDDLFSQRFYHEILDLAAGFEGPEKIYVAGRPIVEGSLAALAPKDMKTMAPLVILAIMIILFLVLKSVKSTILNILIVLLSTIWVFGLMALFNVPTYSVSTMIPVMLIAIGVAYGIHLFSHLELFMQSHPQATKQQAIFNMIETMWKPVVMTAITTAVGFSSLLTSQVYPVKYFGIFTAFGVLAAMALSLLLLPAVLLVFGLPKIKLKANGGKGEKNFQTRLAGKYTTWIIGKKYITLIATVVVIAIALFGVSKVWINSSFLDNFEKDSSIVITDRFINEHFGGTSSLNLILEAGNKDGFKNPEVLRLIDRLQQEVETLEMVGNSFSLSDYLKRMNMAMHADNPDYYNIPDSSELIAQYLLLYEMSGDPENLWKVVDYNFSRANVTIQLKSDDSRAISSAIDVISKYQADFNSQQIEINYAGSGYKSLVFTDLILEGQISSLLLSLVIIIVLISLMFKNLIIGLIGSIPIIITSTVNFGMMGLLNIPLSTTTALVSSIAIGIGIDYAIHFIERYKEYAASTGNKELTGKLTMYHAGRAILFNAVVIIVGFLVLIFSVFPPNRTLGILVAFNMFTSFWGTITVMFVLLYSLNLYFKKRKQKP